MWRGRTGKPDPLRQTFKGSFMNPMCVGLADIEEHYITSMCKYINVLVLTCSILTRVGFYIYLGTGVELGMWDVEGTAFRKYMCTRSTIWTPDFLQQQNAIDNENIIGVKKRDYFVSSFCFYSEVWKAVGRHAQFIHMWQNTYKDLYKKVQDIHRCQTSLPPLEAGRHKVRDPASMDHW